MVSTRLSVILMSVVGLLAASAFVAVETYPSEYSVKPNLYSWNSDFANGSAFDELVTAYAVVCGEAHGLHGP